MSDNTRQFLQRTLPLDGLREAGLPELALKQQVTHAWGQPAVVAETPWHWLPGEQSITQIPSKHRVRLHLTLKGCTR